MSDIFKEYIEAQQIAQGKRLKEARIKTGLGLLEFAARAGVHRNTQRNYENGTRAIGAEYCKAIDSLVVDVYYIVSGETIADFPLRAGHIANLVFTRRNIGVDPKVMFALFYLLGLNDISKVVKDNEYVLSGNQTSDLITLAFERGEVFYAAYEQFMNFFAVLNRELDLRNDCPQWASFLFETVALYDEIRDSLHLSVEDGLRIAAEGVLKRHEAQKRGK